MPEEAASAHSFFVCVLVSSRSRRKGQQYVLALLHSSTWDTAHGRKLGQRPETDRLSTCYRRKDGWRSVTLEGQQSVSMLCVNLVETWAQTHLCHNSGSHLRHITNFDEQQVAEES